MNKHIRLIPIVMFSALASIPNTVFAADLYEHAQEIERYQEERVDYEEERRADLKDNIEALDEKQDEVRQTERKQKAQKLRDIVEGKDKSLIGDDVPAEAEEERIDEKIDELKDDYSDTGTRLDVLQDDEPLDRDLY